MTFVFIIVGALLYGCLLSYGSIKLFTNTYLSFALLIPLIVGRFFGCLPAGLCAFLGSLCADLFANTLLWYDWALGSFFMGLIVGMFAFYQTDLHDKFTLNQFLYYCLTIIIGNLFGYLVVTPLLTSLIYPQQLELTLVQLSVAIPINIILQILIGSLMLLAIRIISIQRSKLKNTRR